MERPPQISEDTSTKAISRVKVLLVLAMLFVLAIPLSMFGGRSILVVIAGLIIYSVYLYMRNWRSHQSFLKRHFSLKALIKIFLAIGLFILCAAPTLYPSRYLTLVGIHALFRWNNKIHPRLLYFLFAVIILSIGAYVDFAILSSDNILSPEAHKRFSYVGLCDLWLRFIVVLYIFLELYNLGREISQGNPPTSDETVSRGRVEARRFMICFYVLLIPSGMGILISGPGTGHNEMWFLQAMESWLSLLIFLAFWKLSKKLPEGTLTDPMLKIFPEKVHRLITWSVVFLSIPVFIMYPYMVWYLADSK